MKQVLLLFITMLFVPILSVGQGIYFQDLRVEEAVAKAKKEGKMIFIDCVTEFCGPCRMMAKNIFPQKECGKYFNKKFINLKIDLDKHPDGKAIAREYQIRNVPTFIILNGNGNLAGKKIGTAGSGDASGFISEIENAVHAWSQIQKLEKEYYATRDEYILTQYVNALDHARYPDVIAKVLADFCKEKKDYPWERNQGWKWINLFVNTPDHPLFQYLNQNLNRFTGRQGALPVYGKIVETYKPYVYGNLKMNESVATDAFNDLNKLYALGIEEAKWMSKLLQVKKWLSEDSETSFSQALDVIEIDIPSCTSTETFIKFIQTLNQLKEKLTRSQKKRLAFILKGEMNNCDRKKRELSNLYGDLSLGDSFFIFPNQEK